MNCICIGGKQVECYSGKIPLNRCGFAGICGDLGVPKSTQPLNRAPEPKPDGWIEDVMDIGCDFLPVGSNACRKAGELLDRAVLGSSSSSSSSEED